MNTNNLGCLGFFIVLFFVGLIEWCFAWIIASVLCWAIPSIVMSNKIVFLIWVILLFVVDI